MKVLMDIRDMPGYNPSVTNGVDSVSAGRVGLRNSNIPAERKVFAGDWTYPTWRMYPNCIRHGAMNKVDASGIWRCCALGCDNGCYYA